MRLWARPLVAGLVLVVATACARPRAPEVAVDTSQLTARAQALVDDVDDRFPLSDDVHHGVLDNGLRW